MYTEEVEEWNNLKPYSLFNINIFPFSLDYRLTRTNYKSSGDRCNENSAGANWGVKRIPAQVRNW